MIKNEEIAAMMRARKKSRIENIPEQVIAARLAAAIKQAVDDPGRNTTRNVITTSYALHIVIEAVANELHIDVQQFKKDCGVGQPLAYFV